MIPQRLVRRRIGQPDLDSPFGPIRPYETNPDLQTRNSAICLRRCSLAEDH